MEINLNKENYHEGNIATHVIEREGKKQSSILIYYIDTIWTKYGPNSEADVSDKDTITPTTVMDDIRAPD